MEAERRTVGRPRGRRGPRGKLADAMRAARAARGLTQEQAAADLGIDRVTLARIETGAGKPTGLALRYLLEVWIPQSFNNGGVGENLQADA